MNLELTEQQTKQVVLDYLYRKVTDCLNRNPADLKENEKLFDELHHCVAACLGVGAHILEADEYQEWLNDLEFFAKRVGALNELARINQEMGLYD